MADCQFFHDFVFTNGSAKNRQLFRAFYQRVKFYKCSTSAKFAEFACLKNQLYGILLRNLKNNASIWKVLGHGNLATALYSCHKIVEFKVGSSN